MLNLLRKKREEVKEISAKDYYTLAEIEELVKNTSVRGWAGYDLEGSLEEELKKFGLSPAHLLPCERWERYLEDKIYEILESACPGWSEFSYVVVDDPELEKFKRERKKVSII